MKILWKFLPAFLIALAAAQNALAQGELHLSLHRDFGYGGFDNKIEGLFSLEVQGPEDLMKVGFYIDEKIMASIDEAPFQFQFSTNDYAPDEYHLYAIGFTASGAQLRSNEITRVFMTKEESRNAVMGIIVPMVGIILLLMLAAAGIPALLGRKEKVGKYGILGGTVCPKCGLPFSLKALGISWFSGKWQRCPHCGKWSVVKRVSPEALADAEAPYRGEDTNRATAENMKQRVRRQIDDSRYDNQG